MSTYVNEGVFDDKGGVGSADTGGYVVSGSISSDEGSFTTEQRKKQSTDIHKILHSAYTFVRSMETNASVAALTLDHLLKEHIQSLKKGEKRVMSDANGTGIGSRPSRWDRIDQMQKQFDNVIKVIADAGDDPARLAAIGIYEADRDTVSWDKDSKTFEETKKVEDTRPL